MRNDEAKRIRAGEHGAFDRLFDEYGPRVLGYLLRLTGSRTDAEDLTQETFLAAYGGCAGWGGKSQPLAWLLGIAWRRWRDRGRRRAVLSEPLTDDAVASRDPCEGVPTAVVLHEALDRLGEAEREALLLTAVEGLTYAEAARVLGEPVGTVKWRVHQATRKLRHLLSRAEERDERGHTEARSLAAPAGPPRRG